MSTFLTTAIEAAEDALANNADFRTWCGASSAADAKANYIFSEDAVYGGDNLPDAYAVVSEIDDWEYPRVGEGAGSGNFLLSAGTFKITFQEVLADGVDWTATNRKAFKDFVFGQVQPFISAYETYSGGGYRLMNVIKVPFEEDTYRLRVVFDDLGGRKGYMYVIEAQLGVL